MSEVSDVLRDRMQAPGGLQPMLTVSVAVHLGLAAALIFASGGLLKRADPSRTVMTISLGGARLSLCRWMARAHTSNATSKASGSASALAELTVTARSP